MKRIVVFDLELDGVADYWYADSMLECFIKQDEWRTGKYKDSERYAIDIEDVGLSSCSIDTALGR